MEGLWISQTNLRYYCVQEDDDLKKICCFPSCFKVFDDDKCGNVLSSWWAMSEFQPNKLLFFGEFINEDADSSIGHHYRSYQLADFMLKKKFVRGNIRRWIPPNETESQYKVKVIFDAEKQWVFPSDTTIEYNNTHTSNIYVFRILLLQEVSDPTQDTLSTEVDSWTDSIDTIQKIEKSNEELLGTKYCVISEFCTNSFEILFTTQYQLTRSRLHREIRYQDYIHNKQRIASQHNHQQQLQQQQQRQYQQYDNIHVSNTQSISTSSNPLSIPTHSTMNKASISHSSFVIDSPIHNNNNNNTRVISPTIQLPTTATLIQPHTYVTTHEDNLKRKHVMNTTDTTTITQNQIIESNPVYSSSNLYSSEQLSEAWNRCRLYQPIQQYSLENSGKVSNFSDDIHPWSSISTSVTDNHHQHHHYYYNTNSSIRYRYPHLNMENSTNLLTTTTTPMIVSTTNTNTDTTTHNTTLTNTTTTTTTGHMSHIMNEESYIPKDHMTIRLPMKQYLDIYHDRYYDHRTNMNIHTPHEGGVECGNKRRDDNLPTSSSSSSVSSGTGTCTQETAEMIRYMNHTDPYHYGMKRKISRMTGECIYHMTSSVFLTKMIEKGQMKLIQDIQEIQSQSNANKRKRCPI